MPIPKKTGMIIPLTKIPLERVGTVGSRTGPATDEQAAAAVDLFQSMWPFKELHHGVCVGWDEWVHKVVRRLFGPYHNGSGPQIHGWPGPLGNSYMSSVLDDCDVVHNPRPFKVRDREVVYHSQGLVSGPKEWGERRYGGTWYTMRQAYTILRPIWFVRSDGMVVTDWKPEMNEQVLTQERKEVESYEPTAVLFRAVERPIVRAPNDLDEAFTPDPHGDLDEIFG